MKCSRCGNFIKSIYDCNICKQKLCSEDCLISHTSLYHQSNISSPKMTRSVIINNSFFINKRNSNPKSDFSPFLVKGVYNNKEINYDKFYSLDNFTTIDQKGKPKVIGNGSFGIVYLFKNKLNKRSYAIKHMEKEDLIKYLNNLDQIYDEIDIQSRCHHPNIIKLYYVKETKESFDLVLEYAKYGTLFDFIIQQRGLSENLAFKFFIQIVNAIKFLHENNIIHRDIKPENILLFDNYLVKLCDFGWSIKCENKLPGGSFSGTVEYMSPELLNNEDYGKEIDLWMLGIFLYELIHGFSPFRPKRQEFEEKELIDNIHKHEILFYMPCSDEFKELVFWLLEPEVSKRCTIDEIYNSKFVKKFEMEEFGNNNSNDTDEHNSRDEYEYYIDQSFNTSNKANTSIEYKPENNFNKMKRNILINRYENSEETNDSRIILQSEENKNLNDARILEIPKSKRKKSERLVSSKLKKFHLNINDDDMGEDELNAPKNNKRNRNKNKEINNSKNSNFQNIILSNSPSSNDQEKNGKNINLILSNPNINKNIKERIFILNKASQKKILNEENLKIQNIKITNYIFNNKEIKVSKKLVKTKNDFLEEVNQKLLSKKISSNQKNQILSLSLVPGTVDYNSLLNHSTSTEGPLIITKEENIKFNMNEANQDYIYPPMNESLKLPIKFPHKYIEFPFDHFGSSSSLDLLSQKTIFNNKMIKHKNVKNKKRKEEKYIEIKQKEPNDNMRRRNKAIKNETPLDNHKEENKNKDIKDKKENKEIKEIKPTDNFKKKMNHENNTKILNNNQNTKKQYINSNNNTPRNEKGNTNINIIDKENPISEIIAQKIIENINLGHEEKNFRNISMRNTKDFEYKKRQKSVDINKTHLFQTEKGKNKKGQYKNTKDLIKYNVEYKKNLFSNNIIENGKNEKRPLVLKAINKKKNKSYVLKNNEIKKFMENKNIIKEKNINKKLNNNFNDKREPKSKSVNKNRDFKFNKDKKDFKLSKSSRYIINNIKELGKIKKLKKVSVYTNKNISLKEKNENTKLEKNDYKEIIKTTEENINSEMNDNNLKKYINKDKRELQVNLTKMKDSLKNKNKEVKKEVKENENGEIINKNNNNNIVLNKDPDILNVNTNPNGATNLFIKEDGKNNNKEKTLKINNKKIIDKTNNKIGIGENKGKIKNSPKKRLIIGKEIIGDKFDNYHVKEIYKSKELIQNEGIKPNKDIETDNNSERQKNNLDIGMKITKQIKTKEKGVKTNSNQKGRNTVNRNLLNIKNSARIKNINKGLKLCLDNISQNVDENSYKENRTTRLNIESSEKFAEHKNFNLKLSAINKKEKDKISQKIFPKKVGRDDNSSNSSIYEYDKPQSDEENKINDNKDKKLKLSENEIGNKKNLSDIKKIKNFFDDNIKENNKINNNSSNTNNMKPINQNNLEKQKDFKIKLEDSFDCNQDIINNNIIKKEFPKEQKFNKMHKNKTDGLLNKNLKDNKIKNNKKIQSPKNENSEINAEINNKEILLEPKDMNNNISNNDRAKNFKKKYKKSLTETIKDLNEQNEKGNDSESYIIEGDSDYGDCEIFKL